MPSLPTRHTLDFLTPLLRRPSRILEVGCGQGELAAALADEGHDILATDSDPDAVAATQARGVTARLLSWPPTPRDPLPASNAILFTRSLHHICPLDKAMAAAARALAPGGSVIVEDFAFADADSATAEWFRGVLKTLHTSGLVTVRQDSFLHRLLSTRPALEAWHDHYHDIHTAAAMLASLQRCFEHIEEQTAPYLYRYFVHVLPADSATTVEEVFESERRLIRSGAILAIGRRFIAWK